MVPMAKHRKKPETIGPWLITIQLRIYLSDDLEAMKRDSATGDEIVEALIENSSTFGKKTVFSQEKYKLKKQKKYAPKVLLGCPSAGSICETYFKKSPTRIGAYSDVLVVDMVGGLVVGAVAERLGGGKDSDGTSNAPRSPKPGKAPSPEKMKYWKEHGFSSLIVAAPGHEVERLVADLLPLLLIQLRLLYIISILRSFHRAPIHTCKWIHLAVIS